MSRFDREGFCVTGRSESEIRHIAEQIRKLFYPAGIKLLDVIDMIERKMPAAFEWFRYEIVEPEELPDREAEMCPSDNCIRIRESVYIKAIDHDPHSRFTLAHELGHFFLHRHQALAFGRPSLNGNIPAYRHSEWQADTFARNLLAPRTMAEGMMTEEIEVLFEVSRSVAEIVSGHRTIVPMPTKCPVSNAPMLPGFEFA